MDGGDGRGRIGSGEEGTGGGIGTVCAAALRVRACQICLRRSAPTHLKRACAHLASYRGMGRMRPAGVRPQLARSSEVARQKARRPGEKPEDSM